MVAAANALGAGATGGSGLSVSRGPFAPDLWFPDVDTLMGVVVAESPSAPRHPVVGHLPGGWAQVSPHLVGEGAGMDTAPTSPIFPAPLRRSSRLTPSASATFGPEARPLGGGMAHGTDARGPVSALVDAVAASSSADESSSSPMMPAPQPAAAWVDRWMTHELRCLFTVMDGSRHSTL